MGGVDVEEGKRLMARVERRRRAEGLTQNQLAAACGISQGQYSKMATGRANVGPECSSALRTWLSQASAASPRTDPLEDGSVARLVESIRGDLARLSVMLSAERSSRRAPP